MFISFKNSLFICNALVLFSLANITFADNTTTTVYTPEGKGFTAWLLDELPYDGGYRNHDIVFWNGHADSLIRYYSLNADSLDTATSAYNCHGYAWSKSEGTGSYWIGYTSAEDSVDV